MTLPVSCLRAARHLTTTSCEERGQRGAQSKQAASSAHSTTQCKSRPSLKASVQGKDQLLKPCCAMRMRSQVGGTAVFIARSLA